MEGAELQILMLWIMRCLSAKLLSNKDSFYAWQEKGKPGGWSGWSAGHWDDSSHCNLWYLWFFCACCLHTGGVHIYFVQLAEQTHAGHFKVSLGRLQDVNFNCDLLTSRISQCKCHPTHVILKDSEIRKVYVDYAMASRLADDAEAWPRPWHWNWFVMASATGERPVATTCGLVHRRGALIKKLTVDICWYSQKGRDTFWDLSCWYFGVLDVHFTGQLWRRVRFLWLSSFHPCSRNSELLLTAWKDHYLWMSGLHSS